MLRDALDPARLLAKAETVRQGAEDGAAVVGDAVSGQPSGGHLPPGFSEVADGLGSLGLGDLIVPAIVLAGAVGVAGALFFRGGARFVTPDEVLKNDVRSQIYEYLREKVGANLKQITDDLRLTTTNAIWHLRKLEEAGLVNSRRFNGFKVFYPAEGGIQARRMSLSLTALSNGNAKEVFEFVAAHPGAHQREIARALDVNHGTVRWHLKKLRHAELLTELKRGKASAYYPTEIGVQAFRHLTNRDVATVTVQAVPAPVHQ